MQGDSLQTGWLPGKSAMQYSSVRGKQIMQNKAVIQKSKTVKFETFLHCAFNGTHYHLVLVKKSELQTHTHRYIHTQTTHAHQGIMK